MKTEDEGHFADKHFNEEINPDAKDKLHTLCIGNNISCAAAHKAAAALNLSAEEIGVQIDLLELRINECQVGLFGYRDTQKKLDPDIIIDPILDKKLDEKITHGRISCSDCWDIATRLKVKRLDVGSACEKKQIRIKPCQLGAF